MLLHRPIPALMLLLSMAALTCFGPAHGKARFLSHVPYDEERELPDNYEDDHSYDDIHDSITKLRGRHYPKLSYTAITGTHHSSHVFNKYSQAATLDSRLVQEVPTWETFETDGPRTLPLEVPPHEGTRRLSPAKEPEIWHPIQRTPDRFGELSPRYQPNPPPHSQNDEEHRQSGEISKSSAAPEEDLGTSPRFARTMNRNVTAKTGGTAELVCQVVNLSGQSVSWIRPSNLNILTVDTFRYSTDLRLSVHHHRHQQHQEWVLRIRNVTRLDAGLYECQLSTTPVLSYVVNLVVRAVEAPSDTSSARGLPNTGSLTRLRMEEPWAEFPGSTALFVERGSPIHLDCLVTHHSHRPVLVNWYHLDQILYPSVESWDQELTPNREHPSLLSRNLSQTNKLLEPTHLSVNRFNTDKSALTRAEEPDVTFPGFPAAQYYKQPQQQQQQRDQHHQQQLERRKSGSGSIRPDQSGLPDYLTDDTESYGFVANNKEVRADAPAKPSEDETKTRFTLSVGLATEGRAGRYTCAPERGNNASVVVHVVTGLDLSAQLPTGSSSRTSWSPLTVLLTMTPAVLGLL